MAAPTFIDSHAHLFDPALRQDLNDILHRAKEVGVEEIVVPGTTASSSLEAVELARRNSRIHAAVGVHPHEASAGGEEDLRKVRELSQDPVVVAIGEIGLDYHYDLSPRARQLEVFRVQLELAIDRDLPVIVHTRESMEDAIREVERAVDAAPGWRASSKTRGVFHCFTGSSDDARRLFSAGFYVSYPGILTFRKSPVTATLAEIGLDRVLLETDSPYLAPVPLRGQRNEPAYLIHTAKVMSEVIGRPIEEVAEITTRNARTLFQLVPGRS